LAVTPIIYYNKFIQNPKHLQAFIIFANLDLHYATNSVIINAVAQNGGIEKWQNVHIVIKEFPLE